MNQFCSTTNQVLTGGEIKLLEASGIFAGWTASKKSAHKDRVLGKEKKASQETHKKKNSQYLQDEPPLPPAFGRGLAVKRKHAAGNNCRLRECIDHLITKVHSCHKKHREWDILGVDPAMTPENRSSGG